MCLFARAGLPNPLKKANGAQDSAIQTGRGQPNALALYLTVCAIGRRVVWAVTFVVQANQLLIAQRNREVLIVQGLA